MCKKRLCESYVTQCKGFSVSKPLFVKKIVCKNIISCDADCPSGAQPWSKPPAGAKKTVDIRPSNFVSFHSTPSSSSLSSSSSFTTTATTIIIIIIHHSSYFLVCYLPVFSLPLSFGPHIRLVLASSRHPCPHASHMAAFTRALQKVARGGHQCLGASFCLGGMRPRSWLVCFGFILSMESLGPHLVSEPSVWGSAAFRRGR